jgi:hypothetical protein
LRNTQNPKNKLCVYQIASPNGETAAGELSVMNEKIETGIKIFTRIIAVLFCIQPVIIYFVTAGAIRWEPLPIIFMGLIIFMFLGMGLLIWFFAPKFYIKMYHKTINRSKS